MKHTYISQGKKFISSKRASKISGYSSDYIGQLSRAQKLDAKMIGHTWFVTEDSLLAYKGKIDSALVYKDRAQNFKQQSSGASSALGSAAGLATDAPLSQKYTVSTKEAAVLTGYTSDYIGQLCRTGKLECKRFGTTWFITEASLLAHKEKIAAEEQARTELKNSRPEIERSIEEVKLPTVFKPQLSPELVSEVSFIQNLVRNRILRRALVAGGVALMLATLVVSSPTIFRSLIRHDDMTASVTQSSASALTAFETAIAYLEDRYQAVRAFFGNRSTFTRNDVGNDLGGVSDVSAQSDSNAVVIPAVRGIAVTPSTGSVQGDEQAKQSIRDSFSDEVEVTTDPSGTAGVITPVFRETKGKDFLYVLVPIKDNARSP